MIKEKIQEIKEKLKLKLPKINVGSRFGLAQNRHRDWNIVLWASIVMAVFIAVFSFYMFYIIDSGLIFRNSNPIETEQRSFDLDDLESAVNKIKDKKTVFEEKLLRVPNTSDPSL